MRQRYHLRLDVWFEAEEGHVTDQVAKLHEVIRAELGETAGTIGVHHPEYRCNETECQ